MNFWKNIIVLIIVSLLPLLGFYLGMVTQYNFSTFDTVEIKWEMVSAIVAIISAGIIAWQTGLSRKSIQHMETQNKISANSVKEMKNQYEEKEKRDQRREEEKELREFIDTYLVAKTEKMFQDKKTVAAKIPSHIIDLFNWGSCRYFVQLVKNSQGLFYQKK